MVNPFPVLIMKLLLSASARLGPASTENNSKSGKSNDRNNDKRFIFIEERLPFDFRYRGFFQKYEGRTSRRLTYIVFYISIKKIIGPHCYFKFIIPILIVRQCPAHFQERSLFQIFLRMIRNNLTSASNENEKEGSSVPLFISAKYPVHFRFRQPKFNFLP
jgi:hypothetical protein